MVKKSKLNWKNIEIDKAVFSSADADGLIGIEECTDYNIEDFVQSEPGSKRKGIIVDDAKLPKKKKVKGQQIKQKFEDNCEEEEEEEEEEEIHDVQPADGKQKKPKFSLLLKSPKEKSELENLETMLAWSRFGLPKSILKGLHAKGFSEPTQIQELTLPAAVLGKRDILGAAETGSGKTLAFGLPILTGIIKAKNEKRRKESGENSDVDATQSDDEERDQGKRLYALILTPTRELAVQIKNHLVEVAKYTDIKVAVVLGGMAAVKQERILNLGPEIVVATPGRLWELVQEGNSHLSQIDNVKYLVIDETDRMLERGHFEELHNLLERINQNEDAKKKRQTFVFSATLTLVHELPKYLKTKFKKKRAKEMKPEQKIHEIINVLGITNPKVVDISQGTGTSCTLTECRITCSFEEKDYYIYYFLQRHPGRTIIFCNSIGCVKRLAHLLRLLECHALPLHSSMQQKQRLKNLEKFRDNENGVLVATDVAARGLDIPRIEHVLHYQIPRTTESYVHRSGRTARASQQGITVLIMEPSEIQNYVKLCRTLDKGEDLPIFPIHENFLNAVKQRVNLAREVDKLQLTVQKTSSETGWLQKAAQDMDIIIDDFSKKYENEEGEIAAVKKTATIKQKQLATLLSKPIFPKNFSGKFSLNSDFPFEKEQNEKKAVDVMKEALDKSTKEKKKTIPLYKRNKNKNLKGKNGEVDRKSLLSPAEKKSKIKKKNR